MAGMETLGRLDNIIPTASGQAFKFRGASTIQVTCVGVDTYTVTQSSTYGGSYAALACIKNIYWATAANGTVAWNKFSWVNTTTPLSVITLSGSAPVPTALTTAATVAVFHIFTSELSDPNDYLKVTASASGLVIVQPMDLLVQRGPANLEILGS
jgi:hypothetical protein